MLWAYNNIYTTLSLALLKSVINISCHNTEALATAYALHCLPITVSCITSLLPEIPLCDCIHLLFLVLHLQSSLGQGYLFISDFNCFTHNGIMFCD